MKMAIEEFKRKLSAHSGIQLELIINENRSTMLNILDRRRNFAKLSMHRMFLTAPENVISALAHYVRGTRRYQAAIIRSYIQDQLVSLDYSHLLDRAKLITGGLVYDLQKIYDQLNRQYFNNSLELKITWFGNPAKRSRSKITFGQYHEAVKLIKIHRILDDPAFPDFFVNFVVYHEMVHHLIPSYVDDKGIYRSHGKEFKDKERLFLEYERACSWEKQHRKSFFYD